jgi:hypothetical protein
MGSDEKDGKRRRERPVLWGGSAVGELKLLELIDGLLTTTGSGYCGRRPQPIGAGKKTVNQFVPQIA